VAAGDVHMHLRSRRPLQDALTAIRLGLPLERCAQALYPNAERHLRARVRLAQLYPPELLAETLAVAERCAFSLAELRDEYPAELVPPCETPARWQAQLTSRGLARRYPDAELVSHQAPAGPAGAGLLAERFGPLSLILRLEPSAEGLAFALLDARCLGLSLPRALRPRLEAREFVEAGWYRFFVRLHLPLLGRLIQYEGRLRRKPSAPAASAGRPAAGPPR